MNISIRNLSFVNILLMCQCFWKTNGPSRPTMSCKESTSTLSAPETEDAMMLQKRMHRMNGLDTWSRSELVLATRRIAAPRYGKRI